jgi:hypothetical protein
VVVVVVIVVNDVTAVSAAVIYLPRDRDFHVLGPGIGYFYYVFSWLSLVSLGKYLDSMQMNIPINRFFYF